MSEPPFKQAVETRDALYSWLLLGEVVENQDPDKHHRVRVRVPGVLEPESPWAYPLGVGFGPNEVFHAIPRKGANVGVLLLHGDLNHPYYLVGPPGAPGGTSDVPTTFGGDPNKFGFQFGDFFLRFDATPGSESVELKDLSSGTDFKVTRSSGNFDRTVAGPTGNETATVKGNLATTIQTGNEVRTIQLGNRTTTLTAGNDSRTVAGNDVETIVGTKTKTVTGGETDTISGAKTETVALASTETVGLAKTLTAGLAVSISAGAAVTVVAGGAVAIVGAGTTMQNVAPGAPQANISAGNVVNTFLGAMTTSITGVVTETVQGLWQMVVNGGLSILGSVIKLGNGPAYAKVLTDPYHGALVFPHVHQVTALGTETGTPLIPNPSGPGFVPMPSTPGAANESSDVTVS